MLTITTVQQAVAALVANGWQPIIAKVAIDQQYCYDESGLLGTSETLDNGEHITIEVTPQWLKSMALTWLDMLVVTTEGIEVDGELVYDLQGNYLPR